MKREAAATRSCHTIDDGWKLVGQYWPCIIQKGKDFEKKLIREEAKNIKKGCMIFQVGGGAWDV